MPRDLLAEAPSRQPRDLLASGFSPASPSPETGYGEQIFSGLLEGATGVLGAPVDIANAAIGLGMQGINRVFGTNLQPSAEPLGGSAGLRRGLAIAPASDQTGHQVARRVSQSVGGAMVPLAGTAQTAGQLAAGLGTAAGGGFGGAVAQQAFPGNVGAELAGEMLGGLGTGAAISGIARSQARRAAERAVPTVQELKARAGSLYDLAEQQGITASQQQTQALSSQFKNLAVQEGLISPTGRVSDAYPRAAEALRMMDDYAQGTMSPTQMQTVRDVLTDAVGATKGKERRIAMMMLDTFDSFTAPLAPPLAEARELYTRAMRGDQLETLRELAESGRSKFSASGFENSLRSEYRELDRRIIKGRERGFSPELHQAVQTVSRGTRAANAARNVGKLAPTGVVSLGMTSGVPFMIGNAIGGPAVGSALSAATMGTGFVARDLAARQAIRAAEAAELVARNGGRVAVKGNDWLRRRLIEAITGGLVAAGQNQ